MDELEPFRDELRREAASLTVVPTGVDTIIEIGDRRLRRRRTSTALGGVLAVAAVSVVGIHQLSRVDDATVPAEAPDVTIGAPVVTTGTSIEQGPATTVPIDGAVGADIEIAGAVDARPAESGIVWTALDGGSPEAIALRYGDSALRYALVTEPGGQSGFTRGLYEQRDGAWVELASDVLPDGLGRATISGDAIYAVGTAPAAAGQAPGAAGRFDISSGEWSLISLPDEARPYESDLVRAATDLTIAPLADGALVAVTRYDAWIDAGALQTVLGGQYFLDPAWVDGALSVAVDCDVAALDAAFQTAAYEDEAQYQAVQQELAAEHCEMRTLTADQLGLTTDDVDALDAPASAGLWKFDGAAMTPVELPGPAATQVRLSDGALTTWSTGGARTWFVGADGAFESAFDEVPGVDAWSARSFEGTLTTGFGPFVVTDRPGADSRAIDLRPVVVDDTMANPALWTSSVAASGTATVATVNVEYRSPAEIDTPTTISGSGYDLVVDPAFGVRVVDQSSGDVLADGYRLVSAPGVVKLVEAPGWTLGGESPDMTVPETTTASAETGPDATFVPTSALPVGEPLTGDEPVLAEFEVDPETLPMWSIGFRSLVASSVDGTSYAVESFADLVGVGEGEWANVERADVVDGRFVIRGWVSGPGDAARSVVLVGTPTG